MSGKITKWEDIEKISKEMAEDGWEKFRNMSRDELQAALYSEDEELALKAALYERAEYNGDDVENTLTDDIYRNTLREQGYTEEEIEKELEED